MPDPNPTRDPVDECDTPLWLAERVIAVQLLRSDRDPRWALGDLERAASNLGPRAVRDGLRRLGAEGVVVALDGLFLASRCARRLDDLYLVGL